MHIIRQHDFGTVGPACLNSRRVCRPDHDDLGRRADRLRGKRGRNGVVSGTYSRDPRNELFFRQAEQRREGSTRLERACALQEFQLGENTSVGSNSRLDRSTSDYRRIHYFVCKTLGERANLRDIRACCCHFLCKIRLEVL